MKFYKIKKIFNYSDSYGLNEGLRVNSLKTSHTVDLKELCFNQSKNKNNSKNID